MHDIAGIGSAPPFTFEAYLNHVGPKIFKCWYDLERLGPKEKLNIIGEHLKLDINYGKRPWQVMTQIYTFRNLVAHGKSEVIKQKEEIPLKKLSDSHLGEMAPTKWGAYCTKKNAIKAREDVKKMVKKIHEAGSFDDDYPFIHGIQLHCSSLLQE